MKTVQIANVRRIKTDELDLIVLELNNGKPAVVRSPKEFINDLKGSFLVDESVNSMNHPAVRKALRNLRGGILEGELKYAKAGEKWEVTANSQVITNPKAKGFGQYSIGDMKEYEKDATIVTDGFLTLEFKEEAYQREENAFAYAKERVNVVSAFDVPSDFNGGETPNEVPDVEGNDEDETPNQVSKQATAEATGE